MQLLTEEQLNRYEAFRRSSLARRNMKRVSVCCHGPAAFHAMPNVNDRIAWRRRSRQDCPIRPLSRDAPMKCSAADHRGAAGEPEHDDRHVWHRQSVCWRPDRDGCALCGVCTVPMHSLKCCAIWAECDFPRSRKQCRDLADCFLAARIVAEKRGDKGALEVRRRTDAVLQTMRLPHYLHAADAKSAPPAQLQVHHIQEAYQQLDREGKIPHRTANKPLLR